MSQRTLFPLHLAKEGFVDERVVRPCRTACEQLVYHAKRRLPVAGTPVKAGVLGPLSLIPRSLLAPAPRSRTHATALPAGVTTRWENCCAFGRVGNAGQRAFIAASPQAGQQQLAWCEERAKQQGGGFQAEGRRGMPVLRRRSGFAVSVRRVQWEEALRRNAIYHGLHVLCSATAAIAAAMPRCHLRASCRGDVHWCFGLRPWDDPK